MSEAQERILIPVLLISSVMCVIGRKVLDNGTDGTIECQRSWN